MQLTGQTALVTGGASGIGRVIATKLAANGASVVLADINVEAVQKAATELSSASYAAIGIAVDVTLRGDVVKCVKTALSHFGSLEILIHSAGIGLEKPFLETTEAEWRRVIEADLTGTFQCCQIVARTMSERNYGRIITLASTAGLRGGVGRAAYGAAKGGVIALTKVMAVELASQGITVNALAPGAIETPLVASMHSSRTRAAYTSRIPVGRYGTPDEVADAALFMARRDAGYITGHVLSIDGGFLAAGVMHERPLA